MGERARHAPKNEDLGAGHRKGEITQDTAFYSIVPVS